MFQTMKVCSKKLEKGQSEMHDSFRKVVDPPLDKKKFYRFIFFF